MTNQQVIGQPTRQEQFQSLYGNLGIINTLTASYKNSPDNNLPYQTVVSSLPTIYNSVSNQIAPQSIGSGYTANDITSSNYVKGNTGWLLGYSGPMQLNSLQSGSDLAIQGWNFTGTFTAIDDANVSWTSGTLTFLDGSSFSISSGQTNNTSALTNSPIFIDYFNTYAAGDLRNQGGWTASSPFGSDLFTVESSVVNEGSKAIAISGTSQNPVGKLGSSITDGTMTFYFRTTNTTNGKCYIYIGQGLGQALFAIDIDITAAGDVGFQSSGLGATITANTWHYVQINWRSSDHKARANVDGGAWSIFRSSTAGLWTTGGLSSVTIAGNNTGGATVYVDTFGGTVTVAPPLYIYFDKATSQTTFQSAATFSAGVNKVLIGIVKPSTTLAAFQIFGGTGGIEITSSNLSVSFLSDISQALGGVTSGTLSGITSLALRDTSAAFDVTITPTSSTTLTAGRTLTLDMGDVAHTVKLGTTTNTITFPNVASDTVVMLTASQAITGKTYNGLTVSTTTGTFTLSNSKTLTVSDSTTLATNSITFAGGEVLTLTASNALTLTTTGSTNVTLPTSGTLARTTDITITNAEANDSITPAADGTYSPVNSITIKKGIITAIS